MVKKTQIRRRNPDSGNRFLDSDDISLRSGGDFARFGENLTRFDEISLDPVKISSDLMEILPESGFLRWILEILAEIYKSFGRFGFFRVLGEENRNRPTGISFRW